MPKARRKDKWELAAEELARLVQNLLDDHGNAIEKVLRKSMSRDEARDMIRQIEHQLDVLVIELWRKSTAPSRTIGLSVAMGLTAALGAMGLRIVDLGTTDLYEAVMGAKDQADHVVECVIEQTDHPRQRPVQQGGHRRRGRRDRVRGRRHHPAPEARPAASQYQLAEPRESDGDGGAHSETLQRVRCGASAGRATDAWSIQSPTGTTLLSSCPSRRSSFVRSLVMHLTHDDASNK